VRSVGVAIRTSHPLSRTRDLDLVLDLADWDLPFPSTLDGEGVHRSSGSVSELLRARVFLVRRELIKGLNLPPIPSSSTYLPLPPLPSSSTTLYLPLPPTFLFHHYLPLPPLFHLPSSSTYLPLPPLFHLPSSSSTTFLFHHYLPLPPLFTFLFHLPSSSTTTFLFHHSSTCTHSSPSRQWSGRDAELGRGPGSVRAAARGAREVRLRLPRRRDLDDSQPACGAASVAVRLYLHVHALNTLGFAGLDNRTEAGRAARVVMVKEHSNARHSKEKV